jgi:hypothetical protein
MNRVAPSWAEFVDRENIRVVEARDTPRFLNKALHPFRISSDFRRQDDCHSAV